MAASSLLRLFSSSVLLLLLLISPSHSLRSSKPRSLVLPVRKDAWTSHYLTYIHQRTPSVPVKLVVDLGGSSLWVDCESNYVSSSYFPARCGSTQCLLANTTRCYSCTRVPGPGCNENSCNHILYNPISGVLTAGEVARDVVTLQSTDGFSPGPSTAFRSFAFICAPRDIYVLKNLAGGAKGIAGLGWAPLALPSQLGFHRKFALCLSPLTEENGVVIFGDGPYVSGTKLVYTPLITNSVNRMGPFFNVWEPSSDYYIGVTSIRINGKPVALNTSLLSIDKKGFGGTRISTVVPYTTLETSIYEAVTDAFLTEATSTGFIREAPVSPFEVCIRANVPGIGPDDHVPKLDLVLQSESVYWRFEHRNSMVTVGDSVLCLGMLDGGLKPETSIVIGGHQLEDNLLQFDLRGSKLGFSSLLSSAATCSSFNFTRSAAWH
ncbi:PREDICTED: basic 7S globulin-like [Nelumbo nucifera]|uniref:Peptidase A1 domain-containing protein n=2 Tax=Nelumbo nucifera TaxID=4432 RepID=A0A822Z4C3_NELNU|nr:PREDICTED: basic 7S globulin-like [Nelumbo nucifera]DAD39667.1 TPA_asm: hypothetical protein HUJ06_013990 [Nelumbo nucifera]